MKGCVVNEGTGPMLQCRIHRVPWVQGQTPAEEYKVRALREFCKEAREQFVHLWGGGSPQCFRRLSHSRGAALIQMPSYRVETCGIDSGRPARERTLMP